jgi:hypothetical protein
MNDETFAELMQSAKENTKLLHGELTPASEFLPTHKHRCQGHFRESLSCARVQYILCTRVSKKPFFYRFFYPLFSAAKWMNPL